MTVGIHFSFSLAANMRRDAEPAACANRVELVDQFVKNRPDTGNQQ